jgi:hypothetical protein
MFKSRKNSADEESVKSQESEEGHRKLSRLFSFRRRSSVQQESVQNQPEPNNARRKSKETILKIDTQTLPATYSEELKPESSSRSDSPGKSAKFKPPLNDGPDANLRMAVQKNNMEQRRRTVSSAFVSPIYEADYHTSESSTPNVREQRKRVQSATTFSNPVIETNAIESKSDFDGQTQVNQYHIVKDLGQGAYGMVKLVVNNDNQEKYAMKVVSKKRLKKKFMSSAAQSPVFGIRPRRRTTTQMSTPGKDPLADLNAALALASQSPATPSEVTPAQSTSLERPESRLSQTSDAKAIHSVTSTNDPVTPSTPVKKDYMDQIRREVAILKKISHHPNITGLVEVLDDQKEDLFYMGKFERFL